MGLLKPDLYRSFVVGFLIGAAALGITMSAEARNTVVTEVTTASWR